MTKSENLIARRHAIVLRAVGQFAGEIAVESAQGAHLHDLQGNAWIDYVHAEMTHHTNDLVPGARLFFVP